ncbi:MAG: hypothetical protein EB003_13190 [Flavobacteriia bacterium]|nr:hypothetical protein [Flavobacteriia bacterium]
MPQVFDTPYLLTQEQIAFYQQNQYIKLKQVFDADTIHYLNELISAQVSQMNQEHTPLEERSTYGKAFLQLFNLWTENPLVKDLILSQRLGQIAADLMQVNGVRLYHDQALFKEGGASQGEFDIGGNNLQWVSDGDTITLRITDPAGSVTQVVVPYGSLAW